MGRLYINPTLEKSIRSYCEANGIEDINAFANRCAMQGLNIIKFGTSPNDNINRENNGIKDIKKNGNNKKENFVRQEKGKQLEAEKPRELKGGEEEVKQTEERKEQVVVRKIQVIKKK